MKTKEKILQISLDLFNKNGVGKITTNHIAKAMGISPGNLYFHYDNKEQIIIELFKRMCTDVYQLWKPSRTKQINPIRFIDENFELYWKYRFINREIYTLRRMDSNLDRLWRAHIKKMNKLLLILYRNWVSAGHMISVHDIYEMEYVSETLMAMSSTFLQFFENANTSPNKNAVARGKRHVVRLLLPYTQGEMKVQFSNFIKV